MDNAAASEPWAFGLVGEVIERGWIVWVLKRMNGAVEEKVCKVTTYIRLLMVVWWWGAPPASSILRSFRGRGNQVQWLTPCCTAQTLDGAAGRHRVPYARLLQQQLVYNGQVLDAALDALRVYKDGTQSLAFLRAGVHLAYAVLRMLEKWARDAGDGSYVRKRAKPRRKKPSAKGTASRPPSTFSRLAHTQPRPDVRE